MAITQAVSTSFKQELLTATHNFTLGGGDVFKAALFTSLANLDSTTTVYSPTAEVVGTGYSAGGNTLTNVTPVIAGTITYTDFQDTTWTMATITARGMHIYNSSKANRSCIILDFGSDKMSSAGDFTVVFPVADASNAIIRIA